MSERRAGPARKRREGFSLIEVVLALGVAAFALVATLGLLPMGLHTVSESVDESQAVNLLSAVIADRSASPFTNASLIYHLPALGEEMTSPVTNSFGIDNDNQYIGSSLAGARYRVSYVITPPAARQLGPYVGWFRVSWPARSVNSQESIEIVYPFRQP